MKLGYSLKYTIKPYKTALRDGFAVQMESKLYYTDILHVMQMRRRTTELIRNINRFIEAIELDDTERKRRQADRQRLFNINFLMQ